jgi:hypothetical protein
MRCLLLLIHLTEVLIFCSKLKEGIGQGINLNKKVRKKGFPLFCSKGQFMSFLFASVCSVGERALYQNSMLSCKMFSEGLVLTLSPKLKGYKHLLDKHLNIYIMCAMLVWLKLFTSSYLLDNVVLGFHDSDQSVIGLGPLVLHYENPRVMWSPTCRYSCAQFLGSLAHEKGLLIK